MVRLAEPAMPKAKAAVRPSEPLISAARVEPGQQLDNHAKGAARVWEPGLCAPKGITEAQLRDAHDQGLNATAAAKILGVSASAVSTRWRKLGLQTPGNSAPKGITETQLRDAHSKGLTQTDAGKRLGISTTTVSKRWRGMGLKSHGNCGPKGITETQLRDAQAQGLTINQISERLKVSASGVGKRLKSMGLKAQRKYKTPRASRSYPYKGIQEDQYRQVHSDPRHLTQKQAAQMLGVSASTLWVHWKKLGLKAHGTDRPKLDALYAKSIDQGLGAQQVAHALGVHPSTVASHWRMIRQSRVVRQAVVPEQGLSPVIDARKTAELLGGELAQASGVLMNIGLLTKAREEGYPIAADFTNPPRSPMFYLIDRKNGELIFLDDSPGDTSKIKQLIEGGQMFDLVFVDESAISASSRKLPVEVYAGEPGKEPLYLEIFAGKFNDLAKVAIKPPQEGSISADEQALRR